MISGDKLFTWSPSLKNIIINVLYAFILIKTKKKELQMENITEKRDQ